MDKHEAGKTAARFTADRLAIQRQIDYQRRQACGPVERTGAAKIGFMDT